MSKIGLSQTSVVLRVYTMSTEQRQGPDFWRGVPRSGMECRISTFTVLFQGF